MPRLATPSPANSTTMLSTSSLLKAPQRAMITSLPTTPGWGLPVRTTLAMGGTCHQVSPVAQIAAASVRTTGVPRAEAAP